jgi:hypothetical protein
LQFKKEAHVETSTLKVFLNEVRERLEQCKSNLVLGNQTTRDDLAKLLKLVEIFWDALELIDAGERDCISAPEDAEVKELCERIGYGAVMDSAARQWRKKDPVGAFTVGPCTYLARDAKEAAEKVVGDER